ncbi:MAG: hypothetical protein DRK00_09390 [Thermoprotei archaeon]|nr:MAG: hypothetical protein DRK00_09390 [Thermoprotei archaeon]
MTKLLRNSILDALKSSDVKDCRLVGYEEDEGFWVGVYAEECLNYNDEAGTEVYDYSECSSRAVKSMLASLIKVLEKVSLMREVGLAAVTNVPGTCHEGL